MHTILTALAAVIFYGTFAAMAAAGIHQIIKDRSE